MHIAVLKGGLSSERDVSLISGIAVADSLREMDYQVTEIDVSHDIAEKLALVRPDVVFNALHGTYGEDGCVQGVLELMQIPYTHSGVLASAVAMDKAMAKRLFESVGIRVVGGTVATRDEILHGNVISKPYVVKPVDEGSSVGVVIIREGDDLDESMLPHNEKLLVEEFVEGRELTVAILGDKVTEICEIVPKDGWYDYKNKYTSGMTEYIIPADLPAAIAKEAKESAIKAHHVLGCRGVSRSDFIYGCDGLLYILETNTHPGFTPTSLVPKLAKYDGMIFNDLVKFLLDNAKLDRG